MDKYWRIGTGAHTYIDKFREMVIDNNLTIKDFLISSEEGKQYILETPSGESCVRWHSKSTANQYIKVWESLGFIVAVGPKYFIATNFREHKKLIQYSLINITMSSNDESIQRYRTTMIINILVEAKVINQRDLFEKGFIKGASPLMIEDVIKSISKYERTVIKERNVVNKIKEYYDNEF